MDLDMPRRRPWSEQRVKAIVQHKYGRPEDVLALEEVPLPKVKNDQVLVRVRAASLHPDVWHMSTGRPYVLRIMGAGFFRPRNPIPGTDIAGVVEQVGKNVIRFKRGDEVFGESLRGHQWHNGGAFAEYAAAPAQSLLLKPTNLTFEEAAAVPTTGFIALKGIRDEGQVKPGQNVLVNGAGGGVGTLVVQLAKTFGAKVTAVDSNAKQDLLLSIGADHVLDYMKDDFTKRDERYDLIVDVPGNHPVSAIRRALTPRGTYVLVGHDQFGKTAGRWFGSMGRFVRMLLMGPFVKQKLGPLPATNTKDHLAVLKDLIEAEKIKPMLDRTYPLEKIRDAMQYLQSGDVKGKIVLTM